MDRAPNVPFSAAAAPNSPVESNTEAASTSLDDRGKEIAASSQAGPGAPNAAYTPRRRTLWQVVHDAFTKPWYGNYLGPDNLGYDKKPIDELDAAAREHDMAYDRCKAAGILGAIYSIEAGHADLQLAKRAFLALPTLDFGGKIMGVATGVTMACLGVIKVPFAELRDAMRHKSHSGAALSDS